MRYLNRLEAQLVAASRELSSTHATPRRRPRVWLRALARRHRYLAALALVTLAGATGAIADAAGVFQGPDLTAPSPLGTASSIPGNLAASFAILRRARNATTDAIPAYPPPGLDVPGAFGQHYGVNLDLSRFAGTIDGTSIWLVPGNTGTCLYTVNYGSVCAANNLVAAQGLMISGFPVAGGASFFIGILPDGATVTVTDADGTPGPVSVSGEIFSESNDLNLRNLTIHEANGHTDTFPPPGRFNKPPTSG